MKSHLHAGEADESAPADGGVPTDENPVMVIGAGPAGLTAAFELRRLGDPVVIVEADDVVGGISRTVEREGWRFDIGGHRFFTKVERVEAFWHEILTADELIVRPRMSRIYYEGKFYDYPIKIGNALSNLGVVEAVRCVGSFLWIKVRPPVDRTTLEGYIVANYGWRLYHHFFETYNQKVWGVPASEISADWGAQRIKGMSLINAIWEPLRSSLAGRRAHRSKQITSLIEEFEYPVHGPGMMWEHCAARVVAAGGDLHFGTRATTVHVGGGRAVACTVESDGVSRRLPVSHVISSMPLGDLARIVDPPVPPAVLEGANGLHYRDFLTVALVVPAEVGFPDNWIYVHSPDVGVGRIQNFGSWSPQLVKDGFTCLGMEYFVFEGDRLWSTPDEDLIALATAELVTIGLAGPADVRSGYVVRMPKAYPVYDDSYRKHVDTIRRWFEENAPNIHPVGRNGMHKYNNQDHSMLTAMLTVENIHGARHDIWAVNVETDYHEADVEHRGNGNGVGASGAGMAEGSGRSAPVVPSRPVRSV